MPALKYKDFELSPHPCQFQDTGEWIAGVIITKQNGSCSERREKHFFSSKTFDERGHADRYAIQFGKEVIDGKHANLSVDNL
jgi:hypothetical protein